MKEIIEKLPPNFSKMVNLKGLNFEQKVIFANENNLDRLSPTGVNNYLRSLYAFLKWCDGSDYIPKIPIRYELLRVYDPVPANEKRLPFSSTQLQTLFNSEIYAENKRDSAIFWVTLIALWNGMRSNEICQLDVNDILKEEGIWCFDISHISKNNGNDKSVKTRSSVRMIPIHPMLISCGLLEFHSSRPANHKLFGDITIGCDGYYSTTFSKKVNRYFRQIGIHSRKHVFHSLRHNFRDEVRHEKIDLGIGRALGGWTSNNSESFEIYGRGYPLAQLHEEIEKIKYQELNLQHLIVSK
ncbi:MAG: tyrosine-type recombinase/integrase [Alphaproteobacteria bacterium]|nr:tyrosine-type recombinase/integrase [Alphaproteobacteria bacterium]